MKGQKILGFSPVLSFCFEEEILIFGLFFEWTVGVILGDVSM